jgi:hypothetical protein
VLSIVFADYHPTIVDGAQFRLGEQEPVVG